MKWVWKIIEKVWPPVSVWDINRNLQKEVEKFRENKDNCYSKLLQGWFSKIVKKKGVNAQFIGEKADEVYNAEINRREILERKASSLRNALGLAVALITVVPIIAGRDLGLQSWVAGVVIILLGVAIFHLLSSGYYATLVLKVAPLFITTTESITDVISSAKNARINWAAEKLASTEINYKATLIKSNYLSVSQSLFLRGLVILAVGAFFALVFRWG